MKKNYSFLTFFVLILFFKTTLFAQFEVTTEHIIKKNFNSACGITGVDLDNDGDTDMASTSYNGGYISWFENDGDGNFTEHYIIGNFGKANVIDFAHIDNDDDYDLVASSESGNKIFWFENDGNGNFTEHPVVENWVSANYVIARDPLTNEDLDFNNDGYTDILATSKTPGRISWFENDGNQVFTEHIIKDNWYWPRYSTVVDIDNDNDIDVIGTAKTSNPLGGEVILFINDGFQNFSEDTVITKWGRPSSVRAADINDDGYVDIAATSVEANEVVWFENDGSEDFTKHLIVNGYNGAIAAVISDFDKDTDFDILAIGWKSGGRASVFENNSEGDFTEHVFSYSAYDLITIFPADIDNDGDNDIFGATHNSNTHDLRWWENSLYDASFEVSQTSGNSPLTVQFTDNSYFETEIISREWDFNNDGTIDSYETNPEWTYNEPGTYSVSLHIETATVVKSLTFEDYITVYNGETALLFNGSDSYAECPASSNLNITNTFTAEAWIKPNSYGENSFWGNGRILDKGKIKIYLIKSNSPCNNNSLIVELNHANGTTSKINTPENSINLDEWQYIAVSYDGVNNVKIYINEFEQDLNIIEPAAGDIEDNNDINLRIGNSSSNSFVNFDGIIDEVRIWNLLRNESEIQNNMNNYLHGNETGLIAYWNMNEANGEQIIDISGNSNSADVFNTNWCDGKSLGEPLSINNPQTSANCINIEIYPNPSNGIIFAKITNPENPEIILTVYDIIGKRVFSKNIKYLSNTCSEKIDISKLSNGIYNIEIISGKTIINKKIIINKI